MTRIILGLLSLILISALLFLSAGTSVSSQSRRVASNAVNYPANYRPMMNTMTNTSRPIKLGSVPRVIPKTIKERDSRRRAVISVRYPQISGPGATGGFNSLVEQLVRRHIADFKNDLDCDAEEFCELDISYKVALVDNRLISVGFGAGTNTWGAHPNSYSFVLNYDLGADRELDLYDVFTSNSDYLQTISDYCIRRLRNQVYDYESLRDGAAPSSDKYDSWLITRTGLSITFDAYQVASYAEGPKTVLVPYSVVKRFISGGSPIKHLVK